MAGDLDPPDWERSRAAAVVDEAVLSSELVAVVVVSDVAVVEPD